MKRLVFLLACLLVWCAASLVQAQVLNPANGHYYMSVHPGSGIEWYNAEPAAERMTFNGAPGHLATITSADEGAFILNHFPQTNNYWVGGFQATGSGSPSVGWRWVTGETWDYANWLAGKPSFGGDWVHGLLGMPLGTWQDEQMGWGVPAYIVEFDDWRPGPVLNPANGHYYQAVSVPSGINWYGAQAAAAARTFGGVTGHLATITSADENAFIGTLPPVASGYWIGGYQPSGSPEPGGGWQWAGGEPWLYSNWDGGEPNNSFGTDDGVDLRLNGKWNDRRRTDASPSGYVVEFDPVPEPSSLLAVASGLGALSGVIRLGKK